MINPLVSANQINATDTTLSQEIKLMLPYLKILIITLNITCTQFDFKGIFLIF